MKWISILLVGFSLVSCAGKKTRVTKVNLSKELQVTRLKNDQKPIRRQAVLATVKENGLFKKCYTQPGVRVMKRPAMVSDIRLKAERNRKGELTNFRVSNVRVTPLKSGRCSMRARVAIQENFGVMEYLLVQDWRKDGTYGMTTKSYGRPSRR